jgi:hypothetical protein
MTPKLKGRTENTPTRLDEQQGEATFLRDKCEEQLQRLADQAENFEITSLGETRKWSTCCGRIDEWVREAADSERIHSEGLRDLLRDKVAMQEQAKKHWPVFDFQLNRLFRAILEIYESVADSLPPPPVQRMAGRIMHGTDALDVDIKNRMVRHRLKISRDRNAPFHGFYAWRAKVRSQSARDNTESESKRRGNQSGRGPMAKENRHRAIARWVAEFQRRYGDKWRKKENLERLAERLHNDPLTPPSKTWANWRAPARSWRRAVQNHPDLVVKTLEYSLKWARQHTAKL